MPRESIDMTHDEVAAFAHHQRRAILATVEEDGSPRADVVRCAYRDGAVVFAVPKASRAHANIQRDRRVCCILEESASYYQIKGVLAHGSARELTGASAQEGLAALGKGVLFPETALYQVGLTPRDDVASFDFSKIRNRNV